MSLLELLRNNAVERGLLDINAEIDTATAFRLVRDMAYHRASDRRPETIIREWRGTCSGKHYTLKALFAELGIPAKLIACTEAINMDINLVPSDLHELYKAAKGRFVDVHNYLIVKMPEGEMVVDATWPQGSQKYGLVVNEHFIPGVDQTIAGTPLQVWEVPDDVTPQKFKQDLLEENFTPHELAFRDAYIEAISEWMSKKPEK